MRVKKKLAFFIAVWAVFAATAVPREQATPALPSPASPYAEAIRAFEEFVSRQMAFYRIPGMSVAFLKDDFVWAKGFGYADLENMVPASPESSYRLASITKTITAVAVLQLVEKGRIDLDAEVQAYVPYFPSKKWPVTVRQVLGHLGGISHYKNYAVEGRIKVPKNTKESLAIFQDFDLVAEPGTRYQYSSYGYNLLGAVVEAASGVSYGEYVQKNIFDPLGMGNSRMDSASDLIPNRVRGYVLANGELMNSEFVDISSRFAGGGARSTVLDLLRYAGGIMEGKLLRDDTQRNMLMPMAQRNGLFTAYGMGWTVRPWNGHFEVSHGGSQPETRTHLLILPEDKFVVAVGANLEEVNLIPYVKRLTELVLGEDFDGTAYSPDRSRQLIYEAVYQTFSHGLSSCMWNKRPLSKTKNDMDEAFGYFNKWVDLKPLKKNFPEAKKKIAAGVHLGANQAFTKVGSYMAASLEKAYGLDRLKSYHKSGPPAFFGDFIRLSAQAPPKKGGPGFKPGFIRLVAEWEKEWASTYTDYMRNLVITPDADFEEMERKLKETFSGASFYPDLMGELNLAAQSRLDRNEIDKAFLILNLSRDLYPQSPVPYIALAAAHFWTGQLAAGRDLYKKAHSLDPTQAGLGVDQLTNTAGRLLRRGKWKEALALNLLALEFHPKEARIHTEIGAIYAQAGQKEKAVEHLRKALALNPNLESAREGLKSLEK